MPFIAAIRSAGLTHLRIECDGCRAVVCVPWQLMPSMPDEAEIDGVKRRLRCRECGRRPRPEAVSPWAQRMASGYQEHFKV